MLSCTQPSGFVTPLELEETLSQLVRPFGPFDPPAQTSGLTCAPFPNDGPQCDTRVVVGQLGPTITRITSA